MFTSISSFKELWGNETTNTKKLLDELTDESLNQRVAEGHRTLGQISWHIITTIPEMMGRTGLSIEGPLVDVAVPKSAEEIRKGYDLVSSSLLSQIEDNWNDDTLKIEDDMYGERWSRGFSLFLMMLHEIHHRGQMTVLMRQAGLKVFGVYGPSKEEWEQFGMKPPEI